MNHLDKLENKSIHIIREAYSEFDNLCMLWSIGKDSTVMLWLARKAFFGHVPFPLVHIDTGYKIPKMIKHRDKLAKEWKLDMIYGQNEEALAEARTYPAGNVGHLQCCKNLKSKPLKNTLNGTWKRYRLNHETVEYEVEENPRPYKGVFVGGRADEEGSRSKERYFSPRNAKNDWNIADQPPEFWSQYKTEFAPGTHLRIHPILDWTELDIWEYIKREQIPIIDLYFDQGEGKRYRSLGCAPCTEPVNSSASTVKEVVCELKEGQFSDIAERDGRAQDAEEGAGLEKLRRDGYM